MTSPLFYTAQLDDSMLEKLQKLEVELGVTLVAMEQDTTQVPAVLSSQQLQRLQGMEKASGKVLLAFR
ncbi:MAG: hypothetical protein HRT77_08265 [Halioglobus sp.]|nr:hypothetical protein [Halioglobus sp.]